MEHKNVKYVMFDSKICKMARVTPDKWYQVIREWNLGYIVEDDKGLVDDFPKSWVIKTR